MPPILIINADLILRDRVLPRSSVLIRGAKIASVGVARPPKGAHIIDARGHYVSPGFIDTHIHGDPADILPYEIKHGTTAIVVAESCAPPDGIAAKARRIRQFMRTDPLGASVIGMRLEGPYISREKAGAQDRRYIRRPDARACAALIDACGGTLKMMTLAPELPGAPALIRLLARHGVRPSIGHSYATCRQAWEGMRAGIRHATHMFNAMRPADLRGPGVVGAVLSDMRAVAEVILDRIHVPDALFELLYHTKGPDGVILVTDSVRAERRRLVRRARGAYRFPGGRLAGSALTMEQAVRNAVRLGLSVPHAVRAASANPADAFGVGRRTGSLEAGKDADIVICDKDFHVKMTMARGRILFRTRGF